MQGGVGLGGGGHDGRPGRLERRADALGPHGQFRPGYPHADPHLAVRDVAAVQVAPHDGQLQGHEAPTLSARPVV
jgi:hypothetical protein